MYRWLSGVLALALIAAHSIASADSTPHPKVGEKLTAFSIEDQHGNKHAIDETTRAILFSADMDGNDLVKEALSSDGVVLPTPLKYVADISGMPGIITQLFALPAMRKRPYPMLLDRDGELTRDWPRQKGQVALIELDRLTVTAITFLGTAKSVRDRVAAPAPAP